MNKFLQERGMWLAAGAMVLMVGTGAYYWGTRPSAPGADSRMRWFVCAETKKPFQKEIALGMSIPVVSPFSGKPTGYPAELCYWTKDGNVKETPTYVLLNSYIGESSPTFCPDCGRLVVGRNPAPVPGHAPPTKEQWEQRHGSP